MNASEQFAKRIRAQGHRLTPQRLAILTILSDSKGHLAPAEIYQRACTVLPGITEATVYRTLAFLVEQGLIFPAHTGGGQLAYEFAEHNHHHLICRDCGGMLELDPDALKTLSRRFQETTGFQIDTVHLVFIGLCPDCQK